MSENYKSPTCVDTVGCVNHVRSPQNIYDRFIITGFSITCFVSTIALTLLISLATFTRYVVKGDLYGYEEWVKIIAFWLYFLGAAIGAYNRTHVTADLIDAYLSDGVVKESLAVLKNIITVGVSVLFAWYGYEFFMFGFLGPLGTGIAIPKTTVWRIGFWVGYLSVFTGLIFMSVYFARDLLQSLRVLFRRISR